MRNGDANVYGGDLTGGSLLVRESRMAVRLLLETNDRELAINSIVSENLFQNRSRATSVKYCQLIFTRFKALSAGQLRIIAEGDDHSARLLLLAAVLMTYPIVHAFFRETLSEKMRCDDPEIGKSDWTRFLEQRETIDPVIAHWTVSTRQKIGQVVFRMLREAGYVASTRRPVLQRPAIPEDVASALRANGNHKIMQCLTFGKGRLP